MISISSMVSKAPIPAVTTLVYKPTDLYKSQQHNQNITIKASKHFPSRLWLVCTRTWLYIQDTSYDVCFKKKPTKKEIGHLYFRLMNSGAIADKCSGLWLQPYTVKHIFPRNTREESAPQELNRPICCNYQERKIMRWCAQSLMD